MRALKEKNMIFYSFYVIEMIVKILGWGLKGYFLNK